MFILEHITYFLELETTICEQEEDLRFTDQKLFRIKDYFLLVRLDQTHQTIVVFPITKIIELLPLAGAEWQPWLFCLGGSSRYLRGFCSTLLLKYGLIETSLVSFAIFIFLNLNCVLTKGLFGLLLGLGWVFCVPLHFHFFFALVEDIFLGGARWLPEFVHVYDPVVHDCHILSNRSFITANRAVWRKVAFVYLNRLLYRVLNRNIVELGGFGGFGLVLLSFVEHLELL